MSPRVTRRGFVLGVAGVAAAGVATGCGLSSGSRPAEVTVPAASVPPVNGTPYTDDKGTFHLVHNDDGLLAISFRCTHQGCKVPWEAGIERFHCPCHDSVFDLNGVRLAGPAPRPLDLLRVEVLDSGDVLVHTREATQRSGYKPEQAVAYRPKQG